MPSEVERRADELVDHYGATLVRLNLESYATQERREHWQSVLDDPRYLADINHIVRHIAAKPNVYVLVSLWLDPSFSEQGWPTARTADTWRRLARTLVDIPNVMFGVANEPAWNYDGAQDEQVWIAMNTVVEAMRVVEAEAGSRKHLVTVQGTRAWARSLDYYLTHPILAGNGENIVYETHVYDPEARFAELFLGPAQTLPVLIGEFGPAEGSGMSFADCSALMQQARAADISYTAWTFHSRCAPNMLVDNPGLGCGLYMTLQPTAWGDLVRTHLQAN